VWAIVVAAGRGERFGGPKQRQLIGGRSVVERSVETARGVCDGVVAVVPPGDGHAVAGAEVIVVHDAARPLATAPLWRAAIDAVRAGADAALCAIPVTDTVKRVHDGRVVATLDRTELVAVQTPQAFRASALRAAHRGGADATDDGALVEAAGGRVVVVPGSIANIKLTHRHDVLVAEALLAASP
jgi:2-C-methyl-D-erythritol 4-phosphate cytidylyltransferase